MLFVVALDGVMVIYKVTFIGIELMASFRVRRMVSGWV